jgi:hypothetical protein
MSSHEVISPSRAIHQGDGILWTEQRSFTPEEVIVTSLPDVSELGLPFAKWREWFLRAAGLLCEKSHPDSLVIFYQSDIKHEGVWVDKGYLVSRAAEEAGLATLFHKVVCRAPAGVTTFGRPAFAHLLAFSKNLRLEKAQSTADVLPRLGEMTWPRAMGRDACDAVCLFLKAYTKARVVVDPFCGVGTMLAAANDHGLDALGVELNVKRARRAQTFRF